MTQIPDDFHITSGYGISPLRCLRITECLATPEEMAQGEAVWETYSDPFPNWHFQQSML